MHHFCYVWYVLCTQFKGHDVCRFTLQWRWLKLPERLHWLKLSWSWKASNKSWKQLMWKRRNGELWCCQPLYESSSQWSSLGDRRSACRWRPRQPYCQLRLCLLPDWASPPPMSTLEVTFTSRLRVQPWVPFCHLLWPTSTCRTLSRGHWQKPHWSPHCGYAMWMTPLSSGMLWQGAAQFLEHLSGQCAEI